MATSQSPHCHLRLAFDIINCSSLKHFFHLASTMDLLESLQFIIVLAQVSLLVLHHLLNLPILEHVVLFSLLHSPGNLIQSDLKGI